MPPTDDTHRPLWNLLAADSFSWITIKTKCVQDFCVVALLSQSYQSFLRVCGAMRVETEPNRKGEERKGTKPERNRTSKDSTKQWERYLGKAGKMYICHPGLLDWPQKYRDHTVPCGLMTGQGYIGVIQNFSYYLGSWLSQQPSEQHLPTKSSAAR